MRRDTRALWALEVMDQLDPALIEAVEATPGVRPKRMRIALLAAAVLACLSLIGGSVALSRRSADNASPAETQPPTLESGTQNSLNDGGLTSSFHVLGLHWGGVSYDLIHPTGSITPDVELGRITHSTQELRGEDGLVDNFDPYWTTSNFLPVGTPIYTVKGISAARRICAYDENGKLCVFASRGNAELGDNHTPLRYVFPGAEMIEKVYITAVNTGAIGEIDDRDEIEYIVGRLHDDGRFIPRDQYAAARAEGDLGLALSFILTDGTQLNLSIVSEKVGHWLAPVSIPGGIMKTIRDYTIYPTTDNFYLDDQSYGATRNDNIGLLGEYSETHEAFSVELVGHDLILSRVAGQMKVKIADDAAGDIRIEGLDVYYRRTDGKIARIRYDCPGDYAMDAKFKQGEDMTAYITEREVVDDGCYIRFQMRDGQRFTLTADGELAQNGTLLSRGVRTFVLDSSSVVYATDEGLFRHTTEDDATIELSRADVLQINSMGLNIEYLTADGEVCRVRCDGQKNKVLVQCAGAVEFVHLIDGHLVLDDAGRAWVFVGDMRYLLAEGVAHIEGLLAYEVVLSYRNGHSERHSLFYDGGHLVWGLDRVRGGVRIR